MAEFINVHVRDETEVDPGGNPIPGSGVRERRHFRKSKIVGIGETVVKTGTPPPTIDPSHCFIVFDDGATLMVEDSYDSVISQIP